MAILRRETLAQYEETGNSSLIVDAWLAPDVLISPSGIWQNLNRGGQQEAFCYVGVPTGNFARSQGGHVPLLEGKTFMVFLDKGFEVAKWRWCEMDGQTYGFPIDHDSRFGRRLWPQA
jgi:hypothetical protein